MNLMYLLRRARDLFGKNTAVLHGERRASYREFYERVRSTAAFFAAIGLERGGRVAVILSNGPAYLELYYALPMGGFVIVPLNNRWNVEDFVFSIADSGTKVLVVDERYAAIAQQIRERLPDLRIVSTAEELSAPPAGFEDPSPDDVMGVFYTSGTTGGPKGAMLTHRNVCSNAILCAASGIELGAVYLHAAPMFHLADGAATHIATMMGRTHTFIPVFDPGAFLAAVER